MAERKSSRSRKAVKYAGLDDESDDDFAEAKPSKSKKQKTVEDDKNKPKQNPIEDKMENLLPSDEPSSIKKRKSVTDRLYEDELKEALQLSMFETSGSESHSEAPLDTSTSSTPTLANNVQVEVEVEYLKAPDLTSVKEEDLLSKKEENSSFDEEPPPLLPLNPSTIGTVMDERIECVADKIEEPTRGRRQQRKVTKRKVIIDDDDDDASGDESDFNPGNGPDNDSSDDEEEGDEENFSPDDDDSDFDDRRKKKTKVERKKSSPKTVDKSLKGKAKVTKPTKKSAVRNSVNGVAETPKEANNRKPQGQRSSSCVTVSKVSPVLNSPHTSSSPVSATMKTTPTMNSKLKAAVASPSASSSKRPAEKLSQSWKAPGLASVTKNASESLMKSPSSGLRLGLSRNQRVKPLHSSVKVL